MAEDPRVVRIISPDKLADYTSTFRAFNDGRYARAGESGVTDYDDLNGLPSIEGVTVKGAKVAADYGLALADEIPDVDGFATSEEVSDAIADVTTSMEARLDGLASKDDLEGLATKSELDGYATKGDISGLASRSELDGYATKDDISSLASKSELSGYATKSDISELASKSELSGYATKGDIADFITESALDGYAKTSDLAGLATESYVDSSVKAVNDKLAGYATTASVDALSTKLANEHPVGSEIVSSTSLNPASLYGGTWTTDSSHLFRGVYVYRRIS